MKTSATDAADCLIATYYYEAWAKIMLRKYQDAIDSLQEVCIDFRLINFWSYK